LSVMGVHLFKQRNASIFYWLHHLEATCKPLLLKFRYRL
jgi:hypothetical protein